MKHRVVKSAIVVVTIITVVSVLIYRTIVPPDRVILLVHPIPEDASFVCLIIDAGHGPEPLLWSLTNVLPFEMHPARCVTSTLDSQQILADTFDGPVSWRNASRYGLLTLQHGRWLVRWVNKQDVQMTSTGILFGPTHAHINPDDASETDEVSVAVLEKLGFSRHELDRLEQKK
jgi:hypothetical protein